MQRLCIAAGLLVSLALAAGCGGKGATATPSTVSSRLQNVQGLTPQGRQMALQAAQNHQAGGRMRGQLMRKMHGGH